MTREREFRTPDFIVRAERHLEGLNDGLLLILKGHLLIEEALSAAIEAYCVNPEHLATARLTFSHKLLLARALCELPKEAKRRKTMELIWDATAALNSIRNRFAHTLEPDKLGPLLKRLSVPHPNKINALKDVENINALHITIAAALGYIGGLGDMRREGNPQAAK